MNLSARNARVILPALSQLKGRCIWIKQIRALKLCTVFSRQLMTGLKNSLSAALVNCGHVLLSIFNHFLCLKLEIVHLLW